MDAVDSGGEVGREMDAVDFGGEVDREMDAVDSDEDVVERDIHAVAFNVE